ncbi:MAG: hypothetical protein ACREAA_07100 [Candidatus Polarisedimenticolia bacterium]
MTDAPKPPAPLRGYLKHGMCRTKRQIRERNRRGRDVLDKRTVMGREIAAWCSAYAADLGGAEQLSAGQQAALKDIRTILYLMGVAEVFMATTSPVNRRGRCFYPIVQQWAALSDSLLRRLQTLGLERRAREIPSLTDYLKRQRPQDARTETSGPLTTSGASNAPPGASPEATSLSAATPCRPTAPAPAVDSPSAGAAKGAGAPEVVDVTPIDRAGRPGEGLSAHRDGGPGPEPINVSAPVPEGEP